MPIDKKPANALLARLSKKERDEISPKLEHVPLVFGEHLHEPNAPIKHLYFPEAGIISLVSRTADSSPVEVGMLGNEGVAGFSVALGVKTSTNGSVVQGAGSAYRMRTRDFVTMTEPASLRTGILRFVNAFMAQTSLAAACNAYHPADRRLARWLLMTHDRMQANEFQVTQDFLSNMLGVRREAVNKAIGGLHRDKLIEPSRAKMAITNRPGLEIKACSCYEKIAAAYDGRR